VSSFLSLGSPNEPQFESPIQVRETQSAPHSRAQRAAFRGRDARVLQSHTASDPRQAPTGFAEIVGNYLQWKADGVFRIGKGGLYPAIERTNLIEYWEQKAGVIFRSQSAAWFGLWRHGARTLHAAAHSRIAGGILRAI